MGRARGGAHAGVVVAGVELDAGKGTAGEEERDAAEDVEPSGQRLVRAGSRGDLRLLDVVGRIGAKGEVGREERGGPLVGRLGQRSGLGVLVVHGEFSVEGISTGPGRSSGRS